MSEKLQKFNVIIKPETSAGGFHMLKQFHYNFQDAIYNGCSTTPTTTCNLVFLSLTIKFKINKRVLLQGFADRPDKQHHVNVLKEAPLPDGS